MRYDVIIIGGGVDIHPGGRPQAKSTQFLGVGLSLALCHVKSPDRAHELRLLGE